ncbi:MAG: hypothetical protein MJ162_00950 [Treponema sp.]|nr:hypothetical protein [Treponema sp.]
MLKMDSTYSQYYELNDPGYPGGKAVDASTDDSDDGTPYKADWMNDVIGAFQALFIDAFGPGSINQITGYSEKVGDSDIVRAIHRIINNEDTKKYYQKEVYDGDTLSWSEFDKTFDKEKTYIVFATVVNSDGDLLPVRTIVNSLGIKFVIREIVDGKVQSAANSLKFGAFKFGEKKWGESASFTVNIIIKEAE